MHAKKNTVHAPSSIQYCSGPITIIAMITGINSTRRAVSWFAEIHREKNCNMRGNLFRERDFGKLGTC